MVANANTTPINHVLELSFHSNHKYSSPFFNVNLDVTFTAPSGKQQTVPAFWAGGHVWKVRYTASEIGQHAFITDCNDSSNHALHQKQGHVAFTAYKGDNLLLRHGAPKVAADKRHFSHADNTPFFWLGDTWWLGLSKRLRWPNDFQTLAQDRQQKGFTIIQLVAGLYPDMAAFDARGKSDAGFAWQQDFTTINPAFFDEADQRIMHLVSLGMTPCIVGAWGYYLKWLGTKKMKLHWRYIMARWGAFPVVWAAAGEQTMPWYRSENKAADSIWLKREWSTVMQYMQQINSFGRMITTHPQESARASVTDATLLDFEMQQTGHDEPSPQHAEKATNAWHRGPRMPVMCGESRYEGLQFGNTVLKTVTAKDVRQAFWAHMLNSGCAGHTYGANGIWQVNRKNDLFGQSASGHHWGDTLWHHAMRLPAAEQLDIAKKRLLDLPWHTLAATTEPRQKKRPPHLEKYHQHWHGLWAWLKHYQHPVAKAASTDGTIAIFYFFNLKSIQVKWPQSMQASNAYWLDPVSGETSTITTPRVATHLKAKPPGLNAGQDKDWLLIVSTNTMQ